MGFDVRLLGCGVGLSLGSFVGVFVGAYGIDRDGCGVGTTYVGITVGVDVGCCEGRAS